MRKILVAFAVLGLFAMVANANPIQFYFSRSNSAAAVPTEYTTATNPTAAAGDTLYLWAYIQTGNRWNGISLGEDDAATGGIYDSQWFGGVLRRWETGSDFTWAGGTPGQTFGVGVTTLGLGPGELPLGGVTAPPAYVGTTMYVAGAGGNHYLYGDVTLPAGWDGQYFLKIGDGGIAREGGGPGLDTVFFGFGDEALLNNQFGAMSRLPDITPEPASFVLLAIAGLFLRRR